MMREPGAGLCPGECHAAPASGGCVLPPLSPAVYPPVTSHRTGKKKLIITEEDDTFVMLYTIV